MQRNALIDESGRKVEACQLSQSRNKIDDVHRAEAHLGRRRRKIDCVAFLLVDVRKVLVSGALVRRQFLPRRRN